jgi:anti-sigma regulatory factor (Ser/Thr protein kinase)
MDVPAITQESSLTIVNTRAELGRAATWLHDFLAGVGLPDDFSARFLVVLDEVLSNVINHALADAVEGHREIRVCIRLRPELMELEVIDDGPAFDPRAVPPGIMAADRRFGGAGLLFVRAMMDEVRYIRRGDRNCLTLAKKLDKRLTKTG